MAFPMDAEGAPSLWCGYFARQALSGYGWPRRQSRFLPACWHRMAERHRRIIPHLHEVTARALCRMAFMLLGLLPLGICLVWSAQVFLPQYQRQQADRWEQLLEGQFGWRLKIAAVEALAPQRLALHEIRLLDPETSVELGRLRRAEIERVGGKWKISVSGAELEGAELGRTWQAFHDWFLCRPRQAAHAATISFPELAIHHSDGPTKLSDLTMELLPSAEATLLSIQFRHDQLPIASSDAAAGDADQSQSSGKLSQFIVKRQHRPDALRTEMQLRTGRNWLACAPWAGWLPVLGRWGPAAHFAGTADWEVTRSSWRVRLAESRLSGVDLERLTSGTEAGISGQAELYIEQLVVSSQGLEGLRGRGELRAGQIAGELFHALGSYLGVALRDTNRVSAYGFDRCDLAFDVRESSLHLYCQASDALGILAARGEPAWPEPLPLVNVIAALHSCAVKQSPVVQASYQRGETLGQDEHTGEGGPAAAVERWPSTWLAKQAWLWLPLGDEQTQLARAQLRLSAN